MTFLVFFVSISVPVCQKHFVFRTCEPLESGIGHKIDDKNTKDHNQESDPVGNHAAGVPLRVLGPKIIKMIYLQK